jgi:hypothetical protein
MRVKAMLNKCIISLGIVVFASAPGLKAADLLVNSLASQNVLRYDGSTGAFKGVFIPSGTGGVGFTNGITYGPDGNVYLSSNNAPGPGGHITRHNGNTGAFIDDFVPGLTGGLLGPSDMVFGPDGNLYVADFFGPTYGSATVKRFNGTTGAPLGGFTSGETLTYVGNPQGIAFGPDGNLYVSDEVSVLKYNGATGAFIGIFVAAGPGIEPVGLSFGPDGNLYVASPDGGSVNRYNGVTGAFMNVAAGGGVLQQPHHAIFGPDAKLYVSDSGASQVLRYDGVIGNFLDQFVPPGYGGLSIPVAMTFMPQHNICLLYDSTKIAKSGSTIPIKLELCDANGNDLSSSTITLHATGVALAGTSVSGTVEDSGNANPDVDFRYDSTLGTGGGYIFNLKTTGLPTGTYNLNFTVTGDSSVYRAPFQVK